VGAGPIEAGPLADQAAKLDLPLVASHPENTGRSSACAMQTYKGFATEAKRKNSSVSYGKDLMDTAFRLSVTRLSKEFSSIRDRQAMADRVSSPGIQVGRYDVADDRLQCLGKESDK
jgi:hypothetical protein